MLLNLLLQNPGALGTVLKNTPYWVWGVLAGLICLGASQLTHRTVGLVRTLVMPLAMAVLSVLGIGSAFGSGVYMGSAIGAWAAATLLVTGLALWRQSAPPRGTRYETDTGRLFIPGSAMPLVLILGIFLTKYLVGIELAMQPGLAGDGSFALQIAALYGAFSGLFAARALRLWRLARRSAAMAESPSSSRISLA